MRRRLLCGALSCAIFLAHGAPPADKSPQDGVFRVTSTLIQIDAVVTDSKGHQVTDLKPEDFEISQDGKPRKITTLSYVRISSPALPLVKDKTKESKLPVAPPPEPELQAKDVKRTFVLMIDDLGLSWESMAFVQYSLRKFVDRQMQPGDLVAICKTGAGSGAIQQFTSNKEVLHSVIDHLRWNPNGRSGLGVFEPIGMLSDQAQVRGGNGAHRGYAGTDRKAEITPELWPFYVNSLGGTLGALQYMVESLEDMPGRKSIVLFSDGFSVQGDDFERVLLPGLNRLIDTANRAGTVFYTVDTTALQPLQLEAQDRVNPGPNMFANGAGPPASQVINNLLRQRDQDYNKGQQGLAFIADRTGGLAYQNGNDLNYGLARVLEDQEGYYLLAFKPEEGTFDKDAWRFHPITVKMTRSGLHVRSRTGFLGLTDDRQRQLNRDPVEQIRAAMLSPFLSNGIHLELTTLYSQVHHHGPVVRNLLHIDVNDLSFQASSPGRSKARIDVIAIAVGLNDVPLETMARYYDIDIANAKYPDLLREGLIYTLDVPVKKAGPYQIRAAVRDEHSLAIGSAHRYIDIPDLKKSGFALTSIVLSGNGPDSLESEGALLAAARRRFRRGTQLAYLSVLERPEHPQSSGRPLVDVQLRLFHDKDQIYSAPVQLASIKAGGWAVAGNLKLGTELLPGTYYVQVVAEDAAHKNRTAVQATDFEVLP